jgi:hypothetical protein
MPFAGERVTVNGFYRSVHALYREHEGEHALVAGQIFPRCTQCPDVEYILVRAVPRVKADDDPNPR